MADRGATARYNERGATTAPPPRWTYWCWFTGPDFVDVGGVFRTADGRFQRFDSASRTWIPVSGRAFAKYTVEGDPTAEPITPREAAQLLAAQ